MVSHTGEPIWMVLGHQRSQITYPNDNEQPIFLTNNSNTFGIFRPIDEGYHLLWRTVFRLREIAFGIPKFQRSFWTKPLLVYDISQWREQTYGILT